MTRPAWPRRSALIALLVVAGPLLARGADRATVEPAELARRPELVGKEVVVDDRIRYFLESRKGQGFDILVLKRTDVPFYLPAGLRQARPPVEPNAVVRGTLKQVEGRLIGEATTLELLPADADRLDRELGRLRPDDFAARRSWAEWAERRGRELADPKLAARGAAVEADALWIEAGRPDADALALADRAAGRPIPREVRDALYHCGFRRAEAQARSADEVEALAARAAAALAGATTPTPGAGPAPAGGDPDPAVAYRAAGAEERARLDRRLYADLVARALDLRLAADPAGAARLAAEAARRQPDRPGVAEQLRGRGLAEAEKGVASMRQAEVEELARAFRAGGQEDRARRALAAWLDERRSRRLSPGDAEGRILLAASYEKLLGDRGAAAQLLKEAEAIEPGSPAVADAFLRLGYRKGDGGWHDPAARPSADAPAAASATPAARPAARGDSLVGLTQAQARARMGGKPDRIARAATQAMVTEQWIYRTGRAEQVLLFRIEPATAEPRVSASYTIGK